MKKKLLRAFKKWEVKTGKNQGYYVAATRKQAEKFFPEWGILSAENASGYNLHIRHRIPLDCVILTHSIWARSVMKKEYDRVQIISTKK